MSQDKPIQPIQFDENQPSAIPSSESKAASELSAAHSRLPWERRGTYIVERDSEQVIVTQCSGRNRDFLLPECENTANAEFITRAANAHYPLVAALNSAHGCATLRADGTCDGCVVSDALALTQRASESKGSD